MVAPASTFRARRLVAVLIAGALVGLAGGLLHAALTVRANGYLGRGMHHLAARTFAAASREGTVWGLGVAAGLILLAALLWPLGRWLRGSWAQGRMAAAVAAPVTALWALTGWHLNRQVLPGFLEPTSLVVNIVVTLFAAALFFVVLFVVLKIAERRRAARLRLGFGLLGISTAAVLVPLAAAQLAPQWFSPSMDGPRTNVLVLLVDALRADHLGAYGYPRDTSPHIDALARDGILFTRAYAPATWTKPSIASLFTSLYPTQVGISSGSWGRRDDDAVKVDVLDSSLVTWAELMAEAGYDTVAVGHNHHLEREMGFAQGFDSYQWGVKDDKLLSAPHIHRRFLRWLDRHRDRGFFAYLHYIDVHWPYTVPEDYSGRYAGPRPDNDDYNRRDFFDWAMGKVREGSLQLDPEVVRHMEDTYDELLRFVDDRIGELVAGLRERGQLDNTIIILTADHGEEFFEHGRIFHGLGLYEESIRVPLIVSLPCRAGPASGGAAASGGVSTGIGCTPRRVDVPVSLLDIMPTVLAYSDVRLPPGLGDLRLRGRDLAGLVGGAATAEVESSSVFSEKGDQIAVRTPRYKYILSLPDGSGELYDLDADPAEQQDIARDAPEVAAALEDELLAWFAGLTEDARVERQETTLDDRTLERLKTLGYIE